MPPASRSQRRQRPSRVRDPDEHVEHLVVLWTLAHLVGKDLAGERAVPEARPPPPPVDAVQDEQLLLTNPRVELADGRLHRTTRVSARSDTADMTSVDAAVAAAIAANLSFCGLLEPYARDVGPEVLQRLHASVLTGLAAQPRFRSVRVALSDTQVEVHLPWSGLTVDEAGERTGALIAVLCRTAGSFEPDTLVSFGQRWPLFGTACHATVPD